MSMFKKCKVILLPTKGESIILKTPGGLWLNDKLEGKHIGYDRYPQHLYITSDDEIKEGDWFLDTFKYPDNRPFRLHQSRNGFNKKPIGSYKVIATTDESLNLPQPSEGFITKFIEAYNNGKPIVDIMVEYYFTHETGHDKPLCPKVDKNNCITIKKAEPDIEETATNYSSKFKIILAEVQEILETKEELPITLNDVDNAFKAGIQWRDNNPK